MEKIEPIIKKNSESSFKKSEEQFLQSIELSPKQRCILRNYIKDIENKDGSVRIPTSEQLPKEVYKSEYIQNLVKNKFHKIVVDKGGGHFWNLAQWTDIMEFFGIEEDFFKQKDFDNYRKNNWLSRIKLGSKIDDPYRHKKGWNNEIEDLTEQEEKRRKIEEELKFGKLENTDIDTNSPEIKKLALQGILQNVFYGFGGGNRDENIIEYKKLFNINEEEFQNAVIEKLKNEDQIFKFEENNNLRKKYPFVESFFNSIEAKELAKKIIIKNLENEYDYSLPVEKMNYFSISEKDFNEKEIRQKQKQNAIQKLKDRFDIKNNDMDFIFYEIKRASKILLKDDFTQIFNEYKESGNLILGIAEGFEDSHDLDSNISLFNTIGVPVDILKKAGIKSISYKLMKDSPNLEEIIEIKEKINLSSEEYNQVLTLGILNKIESDTFELDQIKEKFELDNMADSPEIQEELKKNYLDKIENGNTTILKYLDENFRVKWDISERLQRKEAVEKMFIKNFHLYSMDNFYSFDQIREFIDNYYPETHKFDLWMDFKIKESIKNACIDAAFYFGVLQKDSKIFSKLVSYFNIPQDEIVGSIRNMIEGGCFVYENQKIYNIKKFFPEIDIDLENKKCLESHGLEILEKDLESENWAKLRIIQGYENETVNKKIEMFLTSQEEILIDNRKSPELRRYAIEALANLSKERKYLEENHIKELAEVYAKTDNAKLMDLFTRKSDQINVLDEKTRSLVFDTLLFGERKDNTCHEATFLTRDSINYLDKKQMNKVFLSGQFLKSVEGMAKIFNKGGIISQDIFTNLYSRLSGKEIEQLDDLMVKNFSQNIIELLKLFSTNKILSLLEHEPILKQLIEKPNSISIIKKILTEIPDRILSNNWSYFYKILENLTDVEFEAHKALILKIEPHIQSPFFKGLSIPNIFEKIFSYQTEDQDKILKILEIKLQKPEIEFHNKNWAEAILIYINDVEDVGWLSRDEIRKNKIVNLFDTEYKNITLNEMHKEWKTFLENKENNFLPPNLFLVNKIIDHAGGAGNLKHVESLGNLLNQIEKMQNNSLTAKRTKDETKKLLLAQENRFEKEKLSQDDRSEFYNISSDIIKAAPSLYSSFYSILEKMSAKDVKIFIKEIFPFYQAQLIIIQEINNDEAKYNPKDLVAVRQAIKDMNKKISRDPENIKSIFNEEKIRIIEIVKNGFKNRFGLMKIPEEFNKDSFRSIQNAIRYIGNISGRDKEKQTIIAFYLGLEINGEWDNFRQGKEIKLEEYFPENQLRIIKPLIEEKIKGHEQLGKILNVEEERMARFQEILQEDTISNMVGSVQTVDIKLGNIKRNVEELTDPDIYENQRDRGMIKLLTEEGKLVGTVLSKIYNELSGKYIQFTEKERTLQSKIADIFNVKSWNNEKVKEIQDVIQPLGLISNMINKMAEEKVHENIEELQRRLIPTDMIIKIFNHLGEDFKQESGALALSKDLAYLESLIVKDDKKITLEERGEVEKYLNSIREKMKDLESTLGKIREYFDKIKKSSHFESNALLKNRITEIEKIIYTTDSNVMIISHMTKDLNLIIENMRQCLSCMRKEANNDTNLAFGDYNKFFLINQTEKEKGSISDEIVFFLPIKTPDGEEEMSFVLDRVYGTKSIDVLITNILSIIKKYQAIKKEFPDSKISISVSSEAMSSVGISAEILERRLKEIIKDFKYMKNLEKISANVSKSSFSDNYIEFGNGGGPRGIGERIFSGLIIK